MFFFRFFSLNIALFMFSICYAASCYGAQLPENENIIMIEDVWKPVCKHMCQNELIALGMVCKKMRSWNCEIRSDRILRIPSGKKLVSEEEFVAIQNSGFTRLWANSKNFLPKDISYVNYLSHLTELRLSPMSGVLMDVTNIPSPKTKYLAGVTESIFKLTNLKVLDISNNQLMPKDVLGVRSLTNLECLDLSLNCLNDEFVKQLVCLTKLTSLKLQFINFNSWKKMISLFKTYLPDCTLI